MAAKLGLIKSARPLHILHLSSGRARLYKTGARGAALVEFSQEFPEVSDIAQIATELPTIPWVVLVDQSEEAFWGGVMPTMRGAAKTAWIERMSAQSGTESPYRWSEVQGKSKSQPDKLRVLGYTLGRADSLTPWLEALQRCRARIRGVYSPVMMTAIALAILKIKPPKTEHEIGVLVTPHAEGIRQSVLVEGRVRFSRLALHPFTTDAQWFSTVYSETARLREYLASSGLLKNDRVGMQLYVVLPPNVTPESAQAMVAPHPKDRYRWLESPLADLVYVAAVAKTQPRVQLAAPFYLKRDLSARLTRGIYLACGIVCAVFLTYIAVGVAQLWQKQQDIEAATSDEITASKKYTAIAKNFPSSPLTAPQLVEMGKRWDVIQKETPPDMRDLLVAAGQILENHPHLVIDSLEWVGEVPNKPATPEPAPTPRPQASKEKPEVAFLILTGSIHGIRSDDLRGTRDALTKLMQDFHKTPHIRTEITKKPLDLSTKATLSGSGKQESSELSFEIKLWQR